MKRYIHSTPHQWKTIFNWQIKEVGGIKILNHTSLDIVHISKMDNLLAFYKNLFQSWGEWASTPITKYNILNQPIFLNSNIRTRNGKCLNQRRMENKGILKIQNIVENGLILTHQQAKERFDLSPIESFQYIAFLQPYPLV